MGKITLFIHHFLYTLDFKYERGTSSPLVSSIFITTCHLQAPMIHTGMDHLESTFGMCQNSFQPFHPHWANSTIYRGLSIMDRRRQWHPTPVLLPGKSHGQRSLAGYSPWGRRESDTTQWLTLSLWRHALVQWWKNPPASAGDARDTDMAERLTHTQMLQAPELQRAGYETCFLVSSLGCLVNKPSLRCEPQHLRILPCSNLGQRNLVQ